MQKAGYSWDQGIACRHNMPTTLYMQANILYKTKCITSTKPHYQALKKCPLPQWKYGRMARDAHQLVSYKSDQNCSVC